MFTGNRRCFGKTRVHIHNASPWSRFNPLKALFNIRARHKAAPGREWITPQYDQKSHSIQIGNREQRTASKKALRRQHQRQLVHRRRTVAIDTANGV